MGAGLRAEITVTPKTKTQTHFSLGNDDVHWESVTKSTMKSFGPVEPVEYERTERKRSTVLDYPDMEKVSMQSVHQQQQTPQL